MGNMGGGGGRDIEGGDDDGDGDDGDGDGGDVGGGLTVWGGDTVAGW